MKMETVSTSEPLATLSTCTLRSECFLPTLILTSYSRDMLPFGDAAVKNGVLLALVLDGGECLDSRSGRFTSCESDPSTQ